MQLLFFGFGYSARAVWQRLRPKAEKAWGTTREPAKLGEIEAAGITPVLYDASPHPNPHPQGGRELAAALRDATHILVSIAPDNHGDPVLRHFRGEIATLKPESVIYLSTVGVYGDHDGAWVDETSECRPVSERSRQRVAAEQEWQAFEKDAGVPVAIVRLAGIYGPGRGPFEKIRKRDGAAHHQAGAGVQPHPCR